MMSAFFRAGAGIQKHFFSLNGGRLPADPACVPVAFSSDTNRAIPSPALLPCGQQGPTPADGPQRNSRLTGQIFPKMLFFHERRSGFCENVL